MMAEVDAPPGFRAISMTQAVMEYSKSIFDIKESEDNEDMNQALQLSSLVWNYAIDVESGDANEKMTLGLAMIFTPAIQPAGGATVGLASKAAPSNAKNNIAPSASALKR